jgi:nucleotide-binding universal stress UspA family protein
MVFTRILVATDFSACADAALRAATALARAMGSTLAIVHVQSPLPAYAFAEGAAPDLARLEEDQRRWAQERLEQQAETVRASGLGVSTAIRVGTPADEVVEAAREMGADLIVVGTHGRTGLNRLLIGSVAERIVRTAPCPVLTIRDPVCGQEEAVRERAAA